MAHRCRQSIPARQETLDWLRDRVTASGGCLTVGKGLSASGLWSAFRAMSRRLFTRRKSPPSFYALRHAASAKLKAAGFDAEVVARGMGHTSTFSQKVYEMRSQGSGACNIEIKSSNPVRCRHIRQSENHAYKTLGQRRNHSPG